MAGYVSKSAQLDHRAVLSPKTATSCKERYLCPPETLTILQAIVYAPTFYTILTPQTLQALKPKVLKPYNPKPPKTESLNPETLSTRSAHELYNPTAFNNETFTKIAKPSAPESPLRCASEAGAGKTAKGEQRHTGTH